MSYKEVRYDIIVSPCFSLRHDGTKGQQWGWSISLFLNSSRARAASYYPNIVLAFLSSKKSLGSLEFGACVLPTLPM